jgi:hypothetical protein
MAAAEGSDNPNPIELQRYLKGVDYPASRQDLIQWAEQEGAPEDLRSTLERLDADRFDSPGGARYG